MDGQFGPLRGDLSEIHTHLNICGSNSNVREIERIIRAIKERICGTYTTLEVRNFSIV